MPTYLKLEFFLCLNFFSDWVIFVFELPPHLDCTFRLVILRLNCQSAVRWGDSISVAITKKVRDLGNAACQLVSPLSLLYYWAGYRLLVND